MMPEVVPLTDQHLDEAAQALIQAFQDYPSMLALFEGLDDKESRVWLTQIATTSLATCLRRGWVVGIRNHNLTAAVALIYPPKTYPTPLTDQVKQISTTLWHAGVFKRKSWIVLKRAMVLMGEGSKLHPKQLHYYVDWIGVHPDCQGQGLGSLILKELCQKADQEQVGCYLETLNPRAVTLYERIGFQTRLVKKLLDVPVWFMWRDPQKLS